MHLETSKHAQTEEEAVAEEDHGYKGFETHDLFFLTNSIIYEIYMEKEG